MEPPTEYERGYIEGAARALWEVLRSTDPSFNHCKAYDPATVKDDAIHSYVFDLKDGGRHHPISDYESAEEVLTLMVREALEALKD